MVSKEDLCKMISIIIGNPAENLSKIMKRETRGTKKNPVLFRPLKRRGMIFPSPLTWMLIAALAVPFACATAPGTSGSAASRLVDKINGGPVVPRHANSIFIGEFTDLSGKADIARRLAMKVKELINRDGRLAVAPGAAGSDLALSAAVTGFQIQPVEYGNQGIPVKKRMLLTASVILLDMTRGRTIFGNRAVQSFTEYSETVPPVMSEYQAIDSVIEKMAERIRAQTITGWYTDYMTPVEKGTR